jgi:hypothetical protein
MEDWTVRPCMPHNTMLGYLRTRRFWKRYVRPKNIVEDIKGKPP